MNKNEYIWNILTMGIEYLKISLCHVGMMWKILFYMYMDESHKMDENSGRLLNINKLFG
jgi:hypothetical protein